MLLYWLKSKTSPSGAFVQKPSGSIALTQSEAAQAVFDYWTEFWKQSEAESPSVEARCHSITDGMGECAPLVWGAPTGAQLLQRAQKCRGAGGPDSWTGTELRYLPPEIFDMFSLLGSRWLQAGCVPEQFSESRMVLLAKEGKVNAQNVVQVEHLRPITILSIWWRLWMSTLLQTPEVKAWVSQHVPCEFAVGHNIPTERVAFELLDRFCRDKGLLTLDYSKAFDRLHPQVTLSLLRKLGWPENLVNLVKVVGCVWSNQRRWVHWKSEVCPTPLVSSAMPQGDPAGPLIMTLWIISGRQFVQSQVEPLLGSVFTRVYVDDRTLVSTSAEALADHFDKWTAWSAQDGLVESSKKACVVGRGKHMVSRLKGVFQSLS